MTNYIRINDCRETSTGLPPFKVRQECLDPDYEYEWQRVQKLRKTNDPLVSGLGHYSNFDFYKKKGTILGPVPIKSSAGRPKYDF